MITLTHLRKASKLCLFDPKVPETEWNVFARDMTSMSHFNQARFQLTMYFDGVRGIEAIMYATWHLLAGMAKHEEIRYTIQKTERGRSPRKDS